MEFRKLFGDLRSELKKTGEEIDLDYVLAEIAQLPLEMAEEVKDSLLPYVLREITQKKIKDAFLETFLDGEVFVKLVALYPEFISDWPKKLKVSDMETFHSLIELLNEGMLPNLTSLLVFDVPIGRNGISELTGVKQFKKLTELIIWKGDLGDDGAIDLSEQISEDHEIKLKLPMNGISKEVFETCLKKYITQLGRQKEKARKNPITRCKKTGKFYLQSSYRRVRGKEAAMNYAAFRELQIKLDIFGLTDAEKTEYTAWIKFPDNVKARNLLIKQTTTDLSNEEKRRLSQWKKDSQYYKQSERLKPRRR